MDWLVADSFDLVKGLSVYYQNKPSDLFVYTPGGKTKNIVHIFKRSSINTIITK
jgi:hypothetical protein